ncbi:NAD-dependent epimerase/dehydratase family protein [Azospirillum rugosum]|uniref:dTDP-glucose 4,6-dehydratase/UDP-glucose 4-epimerase n=1 Tax=Azospirillum rugosum TaxID=416170 RepID=A0ABS4SIJ2_9PROT|nr:SDR family NAD(P)-dependent oxidoreductase [Azospirillum rugosum]MBP2292295.1 dTDP-glucose 4,6-dehydratase/UDP-glucose 4-epimerase [Azospirillum rugosum]MDQ0526054.1 dTDP-glucose 4,6-dehydratase/UDP-glucose 4-epimerase [Azospirillum rugosum]
MPKHYLVTGGSGFIGAALVRRLVQDGHQVRVLDDNSRGHPRRLGDVVNAVEFVTGDIRDLAAVTKAVKGVDGVLHLAAVNGTKHFYEKPETVLDVGVRGMLNVLDACRSEGVGDLVLASSSEAYQTPPVVPTPEDIPLVVPDVLNPRYSYGGSKLISELLAVNWGRTGFDRVAIFRPHNVYGADMGWEHVVPEFVRRAVAAIDLSPRGPVPFLIQGDGTQTRAFVHIDDAIDGIVTVIERGEHLGIYHVGNPEEVAIADLARQVVSILGREAEIQAGPPAPGGTQRRSPDIARLSALGYTPRIPLKDGLPGVVDWYAARSRGQDSIASAAE